MREADLSQDRDAIARAATVGRGRPLAHSVESDDRRFLERRGEKCARRMGFVVSQERVGPSLRESELAIDLARQPEFFSEPLRQRLGERGVAPRSECEVGFEQTLELDQWLLVEADV